MRRLAALLLALACAACSIETGGGSEGGERYTIEGLALSPHGDLVAVQFTDHEMHRAGFGLYDWKNRDFTPIEPPAGGRAYIDPSFSPDGKSLVAVSDNQLYLIDLATKAAEKITDNSPGFKESPVFAPDGSGVLYVGSNPARLEFVKFPSRTEIEVLEAKDSFGMISPPAFGGPDRVIFQGVNPRNPEIARQLEQFPDPRPQTDIHTYGLKFGAAPELILKNLWIDGKGKNRWFSGQHDLRASQDGLRIILIDTVDGSPELFLIENNSLRQLTHLHAELHLPAISFDGGTVAYAADPSHRAGYNLHILDVASGNERSAGLISRLKLPGE
jgi:dipeptidyl aminopeptidase/acylaminoacyl peptidase